jgi:hypothetical protein
MLRGNLSNGARNGSGRRLIMMYVLAVLAAVVLHFLFPAYLLLFAVASLALVTGSLMLMKLRRTEVPAPLATHTHADARAAEPHFHHEHLHTHSGLAGGDVVHSHPHIHMGQADHQHTPEELVHFHSHAFTETEHHVHVASTPRSGPVPTITYVGILDVAAWFAAVLEFPGPYVPAAAFAVGAFAATFLTCQPARLKLAMIIAAVAAIAAGAALVALAALNASQL